MVLISAPITDIVKNSILAADIIANPIIGTSLTGIYYICVILVNVEDTIVEGEMGNIIMLNDVPGASLIGKAPSELNVVQLKRWFACCGAPFLGEKPELVES